MLKDPSRTSWKLKKKNKNVFVQLTPLQKLACNISVQNVSKDKTLQVMGEMGGFPNSVGPMVV